MIDLLNWMTDMDWGWWPFLRLRPERHERLTTRRVALMSVMFGPLYGALFAVPFLLLRRGFDSGTVVALVVVLVLSCAVFFVLYRLTFAVAWNVRAEKLRVQPARE